MWMSDKLIFPQEKTVVLVERISKATQRLEEIQVVTRRRNSVRGQNMNRQQTERRPDLGLDKK